MCRGPKTDPQEQINKSRDLETELISNFVQTVLKYHGTILNQIWLD